MCCFLFSSALFLADVLMCRYAAQEACDDVSAQFASILEQKRGVKLRYAAALKKVGAHLADQAAGVDERIAALESESAEHEANMAEILEDDVSRLNALKRVLQVKT